MSNIPFQIIDQMIQCFGRCFYYKDNVESFMVACGVNPQLARRDKSDAKFSWSRKVLNELNGTQQGQIIIRQILTAFNNLKNLPDVNVVDRELGLSTLRTLKELIIEYNLGIKQEKSASISRKQIIEEKTKIINDRAEKLKDLKKKFTEGFTSANRQIAGFELEEIIKELFQLFEINYKKSYKTETQQIDGHFKFEGFNYLVEAKWRKDYPTEGEIGAFQRKIDTKLESTRGIFVSVVGYRLEVVEKFNNNNHNNIIMFCGIDLTNIFEGRIDLKELLSVKIDKAAESGIAYYTSAEYLKI